jgi:hypothetical protein
MCTIPWEMRGAAHGRRPSTAGPVLRIRIRTRIDPVQFPGCLGSGSVSYSNGTAKLTERENLTKNTFCVGPVGLTDKENQVKMYKSTVLGT